jgi:hypothetical protein
MTGLGNQIPSKATGGPAGAARFHCDVSHSNYRTYGPRGVEIRMAAPLEEADVVLGVPRDLRRLLQDFGPCGGRRLPGEGC